MRRVVLVAPFFGGNMLHVMRALASLDGVQYGVVSMEPAERLPSWFRGGHYKVGNVLDPMQLVAAGRAFASEWGGIDRFIGYLEPLQVPLGDARDMLGVPGMGGEAARNFRDKNRMKGVLAAAGLPVARQALVKQPSDALAFAKAVGFPLVLKPLDGAGAKNTVRVSSMDGLYGALNRMMPHPERPLQAEQFVTGVEHTFETVFVGGKPVWSSSTDYLPGPLAVIENPWMQYCVFLPREPAARTKAFAPTNTAALRALGLENGISHMEWFRRSDGSVTIGEVGARPPGVKILALNGAAYGVDMWSKWVELSVFERWDVPAKRSRAAGCAFLRAQGHGRVIREVRNQEAVRSHLGGRIVSERWPVVGQPRNDHYEGDGYVVVSHETDEGVMEALEHLVKTVKVVA